MKRLDKAKKTSFSPSHSPEMTMWTGGYISFPHMWKHVHLDTHCFLLQTLSKAIHTFILPTEKLIPRESDVHKVIQNRLRLGWIWVPASWLHVPGSVHTPSFQPLGILTPVELSRGRTYDCPCGSAEEVVQMFNAAHVVVPAGQNLYWLEMAFLRLLAKYWPCVWGSHFIPYLSPMHSWEGNTGSEGRRKEGKKEGGCKMALNKTTEEERKCFQENHSVINCSNIYLFFF